MVISKFNGKYIDWVTFWRQFTENIDQTSLAPITNFSYLHELLSKKVKHTIEALPFSPEGCNRAKSILLDTFGKESEIAKVHMREILNLPTIQGTNPKEINEFSENNEKTGSSKRSRRNDTGQTTLIKLLGIKPSRVETKNMDMLMASKVAKLEVYNLDFQSIDHTSTLPTNVIKVHKTELLTIPNPDYP